MDPHTAIHLKTSILFFLVSFGSVCGVLMTPALPQIQHFFQVSEGAAQLTITAYLLGYALGQLPYGPFANGLGRKKTLYIGMMIAMIGSLLCAVSAPLGWFKLLIAARFIQALGACVGVKVSYTMIADVYDQVTGTRKISKMVIAFAVMPGLAVAVGGWLTERFGWQSCFYFLVLFGAFMVYLTTRVPETAHRLYPEALRFKAIFKDYYKKFQNKPVVLSGLIMGVGTSVIYIFAAKAPFVGIEVIKLTPDAFGMLNLIPAVGMLIGIGLSVYLAGRFEVIRLMRAATLCSLCATATMLIPFMLMGPTLWTLFLPMVLIYSAESIVFTNISAFGLSKATNKSNASAVINFLNIGTSFIAVLLIGFIVPGSVLVMPIVFVCLFVIMLWFIWRLKRAIYTAH